MAPLVALDLHQHVSGIEHARDLDALVAAHLDDRLGRHQHLRYLVLHSEGLNTRLQAVAHFLLIARVRMKNEPLLAIVVQQSQPPIVSSDEPQTAFYRQ